MHGIAVGQNIKEEEEKVVRVVLSAVRCNVRDQALLKVVWADQEKLRMIMRLASSRMAAHQVPAHTLRTENHPPA